MMFVVMVLTKNGKRRVLAMCPNAADAESISLWASHRYKQAWYVPQEDEELCT